MPTQQTVTDKDILYDVLSSQKQTAGKYNVFAGECYSPELQKTCLDFFMESHKIGTDVFNEMHKRGWYPIKTAPQNEIEETKQKYQQPAGVQG